MKRLLHIVRKDVARLRLPWLLWLGLIAAKIGLGLFFINASGFSPDSRSLALFEAIPRLHPLLVGLECVMTYLLAAWLVLEDAPMRAGHYLHTRPVSHGTLLAAKALGAFVLLGLVPIVAIYMPWWLYCGFGPADCLRAAAMFFAFQALLASPAFLVASLVDSVRRFLLWTPVLAGAVMVAVPMPLLWLVSGLVGSRSAPSDPVAMGLWQTRFLLIAGVLACGGIAIIGLQFFRRCLRHALGLALATFALTLVIALRAPWNLWQDYDDNAETAPERAQDIAVRLENVRFSWQARSDLDLHWTAATPSAALTVLPRQIMYRLSWPDGMSGPFHGYEDDSIRQNLDRILDLVSPSDAAYPRDTETRTWLTSPVDPAFQWDAETTVWYRNQRWSINPEPLGFLSRLYLSTPATQRASAEAPTLNTELRLSLMEDHLQGQAPLRPPFLPFSPGPGQRITGIERQPFHVFVRGATQRPARLFQNDLFGAFAPLAAHRAKTDLSLQGIGLVDTPERHFSEPRWLDTGPWTQRLVIDGGKQRDLVIGGVQLKRFYFQASPSRVVRGHKWQSRPVTDEWLAGLKFIWFEKREIARFNRTVVTERLNPMPSSAPTPLAEAEAQSP